MLAIYVRLSQEDDESNSITNQIREGETYAKETKLPYEIYNEGQGVSGRNDIKDRPELDRLVKDIIDDKITAVWFRNQNRLERSSTTFHFFADLAKKKKIKVVFGTKEMDWDDPSSFLQSSIMTAINEYQAELQSYQTKKSLLDNVKEGKWHGMYPYGYQKGEDGKLTIDEEEAEIVKRVYALSLQGLGCRRIARIFNEEEIPTRYQKIAQKGGKQTYEAVNKPRGRNVKETRKKSEAQWRDKTVRDIIKNTLYKGERIYNGEIYKIPAIFDKLYWKKVNDHLVQNRNTQHGNAKKYDYLLRGLLICGCCGRNYHGRVNKRDNYYMCTSKRFPSENCGNRGINRPFIEEFVWYKFFLSGEFNKHLEEYFNEQSDKSKISVLRQRKKKLNKDLSSLKKQAQGARKYLYDGIITPEMYKEDTKDIEREEKKLQERISETESELSGLENINQTKRVVKDDLKLMSAGLSFMKMQEFIAKYLDYIEINYAPEDYLLKFYFKLANMLPQTYMIPKDYYIAVNVTGMDLDGPAPEDYLEKIMVLNVNKSKKHGDYNFDSMSLMNRIKEQVKSRKNK